MYFLTPQLSTLIFLTLRRTNQKNYTSHFEHFQYFQKQGKCPKLKVFRHFRQEGPLSFDHFWKGQKCTKWFQKEAKYPKWKVFKQEGRLLLTLLKGLKVHKVPKSGVWRVLVFILKVVTKVVKSIIFFGGWGIYIHKIIFYLHSSWYTLTITALTLKKLIIIIPKLETRWQSRSFHYIVLVFITITLKLFLYPTTLLRKRCSSINNPLPILSCKLVHKKLKVGCREVALASVVGKICRSFGRIALITVGPVIGWEVGPWAWWIDFLTGTPSRNCTLRLRIVSLCVINIFAIRTAWIDIIRAPWGRLVTRSSSGRPTSRLRWYPNVRTMRGWQKIP